MTFLLQRVIIFQRRPARHNIVANLQTLCEFLEPYVPAQRRSSAVNIGSNDRIGDGGRFVVSYKRSPDYVRLKPTWRGNLCLL